MHARKHMAACASCKHLLCTTRFSDMLAKWWDVSAAAPGSKEDADWSCCHETLLAVAGPSMVWYAAAVNATTAASRSVLYADALHLLHIMLQCPSCQQVLLLLLLSKKELRNEDIDVAAC